MIVSPAHRLNTAAPGYVWRRLSTTPDLIALHARDPDRYPHLLTSAARGTPRARYDILFAFPGHTLTLGEDFQLRRDGRPVGSGDFLDAFAYEWSENADPMLGAESDQDDLPPFTGGWFIYLGYELVTQIEPRVTGAELATGFPVAFATRVPAAVIIDHFKQQTLLICETDKADDLMPLLIDDVKSAAYTHQEKLVIGDMQEEDPRRFLVDVGRVQDYIRAGDVFQVNLSRMWRIPLQAPVGSAEIYRRLCAANPAPFAGLMTLDDGRAVISSSPERLVAVRGRTVHTRPIAGTHPRSPDSCQDRNLSQGLLQHPKERAEHVMLIDLERNDLGRVCRTGTVQVNEFMTLESYRHVHHLVSEIRGELRENITPAQVIRALFPGGTITGCPKVRCMQIIAELERTPRLAYTGSMGYINRNGSLDLNILIRTFTRHQNDVWLRAGAGIVADSIPARELAETRAKALGLLAALGAA